MRAAAHCEHSLALNPAASARTSTPPCAGHSGPSGQSLVRAGRGRNLWHCRGARGFDSSRFEPSLTPVSDSPAGAGSTHPWGPPSRRAHGVRLVSLCDSAALDTRVARVSAVCVGRVRGTLTGWNRPLRPTCRASGGGRWHVERVVEGGRVCERRPVVELPRAAVDEVRVAGRAGVAERVGVRVAGLSTGRHGLERPPRRGSGRGWGATRWAAGWTGVRGGVERAGPRRRRAAGPRSARAGVSHGYRVGAWRWAVAWAALWYGAWRAYEWHLREEAAACACGGRPTSASFLGAGSDVRALGPVVGRTPFTPSLYTHVRTLDDTSLSLSLGPPRRPTSLLPYITFSNLLARPAASLLHCLNLLERPLPSCALYTHSCEPPPRRTSLIPFTHLEPPRDGTSASFPLQAHFGKPLGRPLHSFPYTHLEPLRLATSLLRLTLTLIPPRRRHFYSPLPHLGALPSHLHSQPWKPFLDAILLVPYTTEPSSTPTSSLPYTHLNPPRRHFTPPLTLTELLLDGPLRSSPYTHLKPSRRPLHSSLTLTLNPSSTAHFLPTLTLNLLDAHFTPPLHSLEPSDAHFTPPLTLTLNPPRRPLHSSPYTHLEPSSNAPHHPSTPTSLPTPASVPPRRRGRPSAAGPRQTEDMNGTISVNSP
ncbi:hypothetical protein C7M84_018674 [Penaeus vannamei]|uniref:Uncharacterized protein n=1 Tax=Penaeus vannamei TaxID=6689 RepID=A0A3R7P810_PENVA|nr:hypothetical protein C7M84_018674 [Penaeus vannamei]